MNCKIAIRDKIRAAYWWKINQISIETRLDRNDKDSMCRVLITLPSDICHITTITMCIHLMNLISGT